MTRITISLMAMAALAACGGNKAANNSSNAAANAATTTNATAPANTTAAQNMGAPAATAVAARPVRFGIDGEHGLEACHTQGVLKGSGAFAVRDAPDANAQQIAPGQAGLDVEICDSTVPGWVGVVLRPGGNEQDCGTGASLAAPKNYDGPCRSGWVAEANVEVTAG